MAPTRNRKPKSPISNNNVSEQPSDSQRVAFKSPAKTPMGNYGQKTVMITQGQKQALIDNLQLEVTERARKLRAQYALQAQSLRTRIELRVNRIPTSLRKANMGELFAKYQECKQQAEESMPVAAKSENTRRDIPQAERSDSVLRDSKRIFSSQPQKSKRKSDVLEDADKENAPDPVQTIPNPKKRAKTTATASGCQPPSQSTVLSPKSSNSRTFPQSPVRPTLGSPQKSYLSRPASPLKPALPPSPAKSAAIAATANLASMVKEKSKSTRSRATTGRKATNPLQSTAAKPAAVRATRGTAKAQAPSIADVRCVSSSSNTSNTSTGTTVVKKATRGAGAANVSAATKKKNLNVGVAAAGKKVTTIAEGPAVGRRILRSRP